MTVRNCVSCAAVGILRDVVGGADERLRPGRRARRQRVAETAGPASHEVEPRRRAGDELRRGRPERRERRLQLRLAAEELPEHLHRRPARARRRAGTATPSASGAFGAQCEEAREHLLDLRPRPGRDEVRALPDRVRAEDEPRDDPEVAAAAAAAGPEEVARGASCRRRGSCPSAVTIWTETRLSEASPQAREASPKPPPSAWPPMPDARARAGRDREPVRAERVVDRCRAARPGRRSARFRDHVHAGELRQVDDDARASSSSRRSCGRPTWRRSARRSCAPSGRRWLTSSASSGCTTASG